MEKRKLNHCKSRKTEQAKRTETLAPKGMESDHCGSHYIMGDGQMIPGLEMAPKVFVIICDIELGKPYVLPECTGNDLARGNDGSEGRGIGKKRMAACNELDRGSRFALTRKSADLPVVFHRMNGGKPINVRYSTTLKSERLTDAKCVNRLQTGITKAIIEMITAAR